MYTEMVKLFSFLLVNHCYRYLANSNISCRSTNVLLHGKYYCLEIYLLIKIVATNLL